LAAAQLLLAACVTINIYFTAAQAEKAAEKIVEDILGDKPPVPPVPAGDDRGAALQHDWQRSIARRVLDFFIPAAQAAAPDFTVNTPLIRKLQAAMKQRNGELSGYYANGAIGFTRDARVAIHDATAISLKERNRVKQLIAAENRDRDALYRAIADANGHPEWEPEVRATFARTWIQKAARGWWYQDGNGRWKQK
jgi:uncharacterized protein YdbL (DUF1318 family)